MKAEEAKVGMRVYENEFGKEGTIAYIQPDDEDSAFGCDVEFDDGEYTWIEYESIDKLEQDNILRVGNIEFRMNREIVCWYPNPHFGKESEYNWTDDGEFAYKNDIHCRTHKSCFKNKENCYVIAFVEDCCHDEEPDIRSVGSRFLKLSEKDFNSYIEVCRMIYRRETK